MHVYYLPYSDDTLNRIEGFGLIVSTTTLYLGLWTFSKSMSTVSQMFVTVSVMAINTLWLGYTVNYIRKGYTWRAIKSKLQRRKEPTGETELSVYSAASTSHERINPFNTVGVQSRGSYAETKR